MHGSIAPGGGEGIVTANLELLGLILRLGKLLASIRIHLLSIQAMICIFLGFAVSRKVRGSILLSLRDLQDLQDLRDLHTPSALCDLRDLHGPGQLLGFSLQPTVRVLHNLRERRRFIPLL